MNMQVISRKKIEKFANDAYKAVAGLAEEIALKPEIKSMTGEAALKMFAAMLRKTAGIE